MELLGPSLANVAARLPQGHFSLPFIPSLTYELLVVLEQFHLKGYVHRDIKPANFVVRLQGKSPIVLIDFGCSKLYLDVKTGTLLEQKERGAAIGSPLYASPNAHGHQDLCRKDDLYSLMYTIIDLAGLRLPWRGVTFSMDLQREKVDNPLSTLLEQIGPSFAEMGKHIEGLQFETAPNYRLLKELCLKDVEKPPVPFEWMGAQPQNGKFTAAASKLRSNFDPTGFGLEQAPYLWEQAGGGCLLL
jgi:serine/threonine protein kinase